MFKNSFKDKILSLFGSFGYILWLILTGFLYVLPFVILDLPWWGIFIAMTATLILGEFARIGIYIWAFIAALKQQQDLYVIAFYVLFGFYSLYIIFTILSSLGGRSRSEEKKREAEYLNEEYENKLKELGGLEKELEVLEEKKKSKGPQTAYEEAMQQIELLKKETEILKKKKEIEELKERMPTVRKHR